MSNEGLKMGSDFIVKVEGLSKIFTLGQTRVPVLKDVNLDVRAGEKVSIVGASGAGKSTLLHIMGGLDQPTGGSVTFDGVDLYKMSSGKRAFLRSRRIGFVFQFYHLLPELDLVENVMLPAMNRSVSGSTGLFRDSRQHRKRAMALLETVALADRALHLPSELSGGEQQRGALARALMNDPDVLIADEPTGNLDSEMGEAVLDGICALSRDKGRTLIMVTHNSAVAARCSRILKLEDGCLAFSGT